MREEKFTPEEIIKALEMSGGFVSAAAGMLKCNAKTIYDYINRYPDIKEAKHLIEEAYSDIAEAELIKNIKGGKDVPKPVQLTAIIFYLKTKAKNRGYVERQEISGVNKEGDVVIFAIPDNGRDEKDIQSLPPGEYDEPGESARE